MVPELVTWDRQTVYERLTATLVRDIVCPGLTLVFDPAKPAGTPRKNAVDDLHERNDRHTGRVLPTIRRTTGRSRWRMAIGSREICDHATITSGDEPSPWSGVSATA